MAGGVGGIIIKRAPQPRPLRIWTAPEILGWSLLIVAAVLWAASGVWAGTQAVARLLETLP